MLIRVQPNKLHLFCVYTFAANKVHIYSSSTINNINLIYSNLTDPI
nr:MAG TPA: hypothetical protein [Caudoviricetes sp.]